MPGRILRASVTFFIVTVALAGLVSTLQPVAQLAAKPAAPQTTLPCRI